MKIVDLRWTHVAVPLQAPLVAPDASVRRRYAAPSLSFIDDGLVGLGEIGPRVSSDRLNAARGLVIGRTPYELERLRLDIHGFRFYQMETAILASGIEMACLDIQGKATGCQSRSCWAGGCATVSGHSLHLPSARCRRLPGVSSTDEIVRHVQDLVAAGYETIKMKGGAAPPEDDIEVMRALRAALPRHKLRLDPNGAWTIATSLRVAAQLRDLDMEWLEDPTFGLDGMAEVTARSPMATATNMCLVDFHELGSAVRRRAVDVMLLDIFSSGGLRATKEMAAACGAFGIDIGVHSGGAPGAPSLAWRRRPCSMSPAPCRRSAARWTRCTTSGATTC